ncbi:MAG TPA: DUF4031 domain-containing protein [Thermoanaerobaculia bacterium]|nr:DUF4031 domain-containing protein [Thermoanaerobaculia bacterium]
MIFVDALFDTTPFTKAGTPRCFRNTGSCHMWSDLPGEEGTRELVTFAKRLGLREEWIQDRGRRHQHFDLTAGKRAAAVRLGATQVDRWVV